MARKIAASEDGGGRYKSRCEGSVEFVSFLNVRLICLIGTLGPLAWANGAVKSVLNYSGFATPNCLWTESAANWLVSKFVPCSRSCCGRLEYSITNSAEFGNDHDE